MGAVPGLRYAGTGTEAIQPLGSIPYVIDDENGDGNVLAFASLPEGQFLRSGGDGAITGLNLFGTGNTWTANQTISTTGLTRLHLTGAEASVLTLQDSSVDSHLQATELVNNNGRTYFRIATSDLSGVIADILVMDNDTGVIGIGRTQAWGAQLHIVSTNADRPTLRVDAPFDAFFSGIAQSWHYGETRYGAMIARPSNSGLGLDNVNLGNNALGPTLSAGRNTNLGTTGGTPGTVQLIQANAAEAFVWPDDAGILRMGALAPTGSLTAASVNANTAGTPVGSQTSTRDAKENIVPIRDYSLPFDLVLDAAGALSAFDYRDHRFGNKRAVCGLILDDAPTEFGTVADDLHPKGKILNDPVLYGCLIGSVKYLNDWVTTVEERVVGLEELEGGDRLTTLESTSGDHTTLLATHTGEIATLVSADSALDARLDIVEPLQTTQGTTLATHTTQIASLLDASAAVITDLITRIETLEAATHTH